MKLNIFQLRVSNSKVKQENFNLKLVTRKRNKKSLTIELVTRSEIFHTSS